MIMERVTAARVASVCFGAAPNVVRRINPRMKILQRVI